MIQKPRGKNKGGTHSEKSPTISSNSWEQNNILCLNPKLPDGAQPQQQDRVYSENGKFTALTAQLNGRHNVYTDFTLRRLTPIECERLQTVPDNYTNHVSDSQRYKQLGNGWTIDVIVHILSFYTR